MNIIYHSNINKIKDKYKRQLEQEFTVLDNKFWFFDPLKDRIQVNCNLLKEKKSEIKLEIWLSQAGKMIAVSAVEKNLHTSINQAKIKLDQLLTKIKEKKFLNNISH